MASPTDATLRRGNSRLPFDILHRVFNEMAQPNQRLCDALSPKATIRMEYTFRDMGDPYELAATLGQVCTSWRDAVLDTPRLWALIVIRPNFLWSFVSVRREYGYPETSIQRLRQWIERGRETPRTLIIDLRFGMVPGGWFDLEVAVPKMVNVIKMMFKEITSVLKYWKSVHLEAENDPFAQVVLGELRIAAGAPSLERLAISFPYGLHGSLQGSQGWLPFQGDVPKLKLLTLQNVRLDWRSTELFRSLISLSLTYSDSMEDSWVSQCMPPYQQVFEALSHAEKLSSLVFDGFVPQMSAAPELSAMTTLRLPALKSLDLKYVSPSDSVEFGQYLPFNTLRRLGLWLFIRPEHRNEETGPEASDCTEFVQMVSPDPDNNFEPEPWHDLSQLRYLTVYSIKCDEEDMILLFKTLTQLTHLETATTIVLRMLLIPMRQFTSEDDAVMQGQPKPLGYVPPFPLPKLRYLRASGSGSSPEVSYKEASIALAKGLTFRVKMGCQILRQVIVEPSTESNMYYHIDELPLEGYTEHLDNWLLWEGFRDEHELGLVGRDEIEQV